MFKRAGRFPFQPYFKEFKENILYIWTKNIIYLKPQIFLFFSEASELEAEMTKMI